jgi:fatty acid synthase subunit beta
LEFSFRIPDTLHFRTSQLIYQYSELLSKPGNEPKSVEALVIKFLAFIADGTNRKLRNSLDQELLTILLDSFEQAFLTEDNIHCISKSADGSSLDEELIGCYYRVCAQLNRPHDAKLPALLQAADNGSASIYTTFGGQGNTTTYFEEIRKLQATYTPFIAEFLISSAEHLIYLSRNKSCRKTFSADLDILRWLRVPTATPEPEVLIRAPYSFPLIGLLQLLNYMVACKVAGETPCTFRKYVSGTTGHSQGIVTAVVTAGAASWKSFESVARSALTILFWIGVRSQQAYPQTVISPATVKDSMEHGEGAPTPMLSIRDLSQRQIMKFIDMTNTYFPTTERVEIALINNAQNFVVSGPPLSLHGLNVRLRQIKAAPDADQSRIPFSKRKPVFSNSFLPITAPFHSTYLTSATPVILNDVKDLEILGESLRISVYHPRTGEDLSRYQGNLVPELVRMITEEIVDWPAATQFTAATHIIDFGPGGLSGVGMLTNRNSEGRGVRVILADSLDGVNSSVGYRSELFTRQKSEVRYGSNWAKEYAPRLIRTPSGTVVETKLSKVLGLPPLIIAGMTPTTVPWDVVAAAMNAGYHIELAAGGYHNAEALENAILNLETAIPVGRGITVNVIYASPQAIAWQIPLLARLRSQGVPIDGLTVGAGVPSPEIAQDYIKRIRLKHISFKPGSSAAIEAVINIAKANPGFPVICQWTGGRAGGHHSFEDFHQPILATYSKIRQCPNVILVAGSGFGGSEDTYPYLNGTWSLHYGYPQMPFDGCLFGSRIMVAKEAHTSLDAKLAIINTQGLSNADWEKTYRPEGAGGLITVISEMGEPIHMLATRGAKFWSEMDQTVFKLPAAQRVDFLKKNQKSIVKRLNEDFQKVWFGRNSEGNAVDLDDMTYEEVLNRLIELLYVPRRGNWEWIDISHEKLTSDFIRRVQERFQCRTVHSSVAKISLKADPRTVTEQCMNAYPALREQLMTPQDVSYFLQLCRRRGQKPVPFIPVLDDHFQVYFKKDSLWQSEDLEAVVGQDVGRTCILHGPVAVKHSVQVDQSIKDIMGEINQGHILSLVADSYGGTMCSIPGISFPWTRLGNKASTMDALANLDNWMISESPEKHIYRVPEYRVPSTDAWLHLLAGSERNWREVLFLSDAVMRGHRYQRNPIKDIFVPVPGQIVEISQPDQDDTYGSVTLKQPSRQREGYVTTATVQFWADSKKILLTLWSRKTPTSPSVALPLSFTYHPEVSNAPIHEVLDNGHEDIRKFYWKTWFGDDNSYDSNASINSIFEGDKVTITPQSIQNFVHSVGYAGESSIGRGGAEIIAPVDYAIVVAWKAISKPLFCESLEGNLLNLVHLSNDFEMVSGASPLKAGETVFTMSRVTAVVNQDAGRMVEVRGTVMRQNAPVIEIVSRYLFRGNFRDFTGTFEEKVETAVEVCLDRPTSVAILTSKPWIHLELEDPEEELVNRTVEFRLSTTNYFKSKDEFEIIKTSGDILMRLPSGSTTKIGTVKYSAGVSRSNIVLDYLQRHGSPIQHATPLKNPIAITSEDEAGLVLLAPASNEIYADASGDTNPIHVSPAFAQYANLPGIITHGMWTSAAVRSLLETTDGHAGRVRSWEVKFVGMVLPNDSLQVTFNHTAMIHGRKLIRVEVHKTDSSELVLTGESEVEQPATAYVFTGQGSQRKGMGMDLRDSSAVAKAVWDKADEYFTETFGFAITHIVKNDPKELTIHFGGPKGKRIRQNFMDLAQEITLPDGTVKSARLLPEITSRSPSFTFRSPLGLLSATQFTQPALTLMEIALFRDMASKGLVQESSMFAGHSLGEYAALAALGGDLLPVEVPAAITFFRGLAMQINVARDVHGRSGYSMCAVNPSKIRGFTEADLQRAVSHIGQSTGWLLEVVNYNISNLQYICAGDVRALSLLTDLANHLVATGTLFSSLSENSLTSLISSLAAAVVARPAPLDYQRGPATVPLKTIDVPFHSSYLAPNIASYRKFLGGMIKKENVDLNRLVGKWVPNITGRPFGIEKEDWEELGRVTGSERVQAVLQRL